MNLEFLKKNLKDPSLAEGYLKKSISQARKNAIILGSVLVIALLSVVYSLVQQTQAKDAGRRAMQKREEINRCLQEADKQRASAMEAQLISEEENRMAEEALLKCQQRGK